MTGASHGEAVPPSKAMRDAHERTKEAMPADLFTEQMSSFGRELLSIARHRGITPRRAAVEMAKYAENNGDRIVADKVMAAYVELVVAKSANDIGPTLVRP